MSFYTILTILIGVVWLSIGVLHSTNRRGHITLPGPRLGRLCLATVVPYEDVPRRRVIGEVARHARLSGISGAGQELLCGPPAEGLGDLARAGGYDVLVVGSRGKRLTKAVLGSTASTLAAGCPVPALIVSADQRAESAAA